MTDAIAPARLEAFANEVEAELRAILDWWATKSVDQNSGGFYGEIDAADAPAPLASKGAVLNARILWFFSETARRLADRRARALADHAADYMKARFRDIAYGGIFWELDAAGEALNRKKQAYAHAFAIYALCAYHRLSGSPEPLAFSQLLFAMIEAHLRDARGEGYIEARGKDWSPLHEVRLSDWDANFPKTANTHLHVLEAYSALHQAAPTAETAQALRNCIELFLDWFIDPNTRHLRLFFEMDWTDRTEHISFGHDIEASWLLCEAAAALKDDALQAQVKAAALAMARTCLAEGVLADGSVAHERALSGALDARRVWWVQAEALVGFLNAYQLSADPAFFAAAEQVWAFIKSHHRDAARGEWTWWSDLDTPSADRAYKAGFWKGPYHNGRAMLEASARLRALLEGKK